MGAARRGRGGPARFGPATRFDDRPAAVPRVSRGAPSAWRSVRRRDERQPLPRATGNYAGTCGRGWKEGKEGGRKDSAGDGDDPHRSPDVREGDAVAGTRRLVKRRLVHT